MKRMGSFADWVDSAQGIAAAIGAVIAVAAALARKAIKHWHDLAKLARRERRADDGHRIWHRSRKALADFVESSGASRALLLTARNCGWTDPSKPVSVSVAAESTQGQNIPQVFERWQDWRADTAYRDLLHDVFESRESDRGVLLVTNEMPAGVLKDYYTETGVAASVVFFVSITGSEALLYVSLNWGCMQRTSDDCTPEKLAAAEQQARQFYEQPERVRRKAWHMRSIWKEV